VSDHDQADSCHAAVAARAVGVRKVSRIVGLTPKPNQDRESARQPSAGGKKRADDLVPEPITRDSGQGKRKHGDTCDDQEPSCS
jgi:hypothetical protein